MKTTATNKKIRELLTLLRDGKLEPRPEFQRRLVWSNRDKCSFIETVLLNYPFPEVYVAAGSVNVDTGEAIEYLVDGQQRLTTLQQYFLGSQDLKLGPSILPYASLTPEKKQDFLQYDVVIRDLGRVDIEQIRQVFLRINATRYALNAMEIHNARYEGEFKLFAEHLAEHEFFDKHRVFSAAEVRRMQDTRFALHLVTTALSTYFNRDDELEAYLVQYNDEFPFAEDMKRQFKTVFDLIDSFRFPETSRIWQKADLFTVVVEVHRALFKENLHLDSVRFAHVLAEFFRKVDSPDKAENPEEDVTKYHRAALQATNDRGSRIARGGAIKKLLIASTLRQ